MSNIPIPHDVEERNRVYALLMMASKAETTLYRAPTFSLLLASHGGLVHVYSLEGG